MSLALRATADELMDADDLSPETYAALVRDLARVNSVTLARRPTLAFLARVQRLLGARQLAAMSAKHPHAMIRPRRLPLRILDVGFGDGDMLRAIHRWGENRHLDLTLVGIDLNPRSEAAARASTPAAMAIEYRTGDYASLAGGGWDVIVSSLVAHHMTSAELVAFLRFMEAEASAGWFINDLHRHAFAHAGYPLLATLARWHPIVRHDGKLSIARAYRPAEWPPILAKAGVSEARVFRQFPFRLCVERLR